VSAIRSSWLLACAACGRIGFDTAAAGGDALSVDTSMCATTSFSYPAASSFADDFSTGALTDQWSPIASCIVQTGGEVVATPASSGGYCHAWTNAYFHLTCDAITMKVPEITSSEVGAQTYVYVGDEAGAPTLYWYVVVEGGGFSLHRDPQPAIDAGAYDSVQDQWWRLRETGGSIFFETAPDGLSWVTRASAPDPMSLDKVNIAIGAGVRMPVTAAGRARFHSYNTPPPCT
jgi:hypothetical protein